MLCKEYLSGDLIHHFGVVATFGRAATDDLTCMARHLVYMENLKEGRLVVQLLVCSLHVMVKIICSCSSYL